MSLRDIITDLAGVTVTAGAVTPTVRYLDTITESVEPASLPVRLIVPTSDIGGTESPSGEPMGACGTGAGASVEWHIGDLLLIEAEPLRRIGENQALVVDYMDAYTDALRQTRTLGGAVVQSWALNPGMYEWPTGSGRWFYGVLATVIVRETRT